jgi:hypothetical protein
MILPGETRATTVQSALELSMSPLGTVESVAERLKVVPPMVRVVVADYFSRGWGVGSLRCDLYYDERMYGCNADWNRHYVQWLNFFGPPTDEGDVPSAVTKDVLRDALVQKGIVCPKAMTRKAMLEQARQFPGLLSNLIATAFPNQVTVRPEWIGLVSQWAQRFRAVQPVGAALINLLASSALKG